jgi:hypothetical protein
MSQPFRGWASDAVRLAIADTSPINYRILIGHIDILPALFDKVIDGLRSQGTPGGGIR